MEQLPTHHTPSCSLELVQHQALVSHLFQGYPVQVAICYDQLFRQAGARDPLLWWDTFKEDLLMWCSTRRSFQAPISSRLGPPTHRPNSGLSTPATTNTNGPSRRTHRFERALGNYPDKAFVTWLLDAIDNGLSIGYSGPRTPHIAPNLISAHCHPAVSDKELQKELQSGRILGPYKDRLPNLRCSGVGVVPKKGGQWRVIMHLSAPPGSSINDYISQTEYDPAPIHLGECCTYGKGRLKFCFSHGPCSASSLGAPWNLLERSLLC